MNPPINSKNRKEWFDYWKKHLSSAKRVHKKEVVDWAAKVIKEYAGETDTNSDTGEKYTQMAQVIMAVEETVQPHLYFKNPTMYAKAKQTKSPWVKREDQVADIVNYEYKDIKDSGHGLELENELCVLDARILPYGVTETTWDVEGDIFEDKDEQSLLDKAKSFITGEESQQIQKIPLITKERQCTERIDPLKVILDYRADHITKQRAIIKIMDVSTYQLKKPKYEQDKVAMLEPTVTINSDYENKNAEQKKSLGADEDSKGFRIYEIEDLDNRVIHTIAEGFDDFIEFGTEHPLPEGSKYSFLWFLEKPSGVYPLPPLKFYRQRASEFSYIYTQISKQIDKFLPKVGFDISRLDKPDQEKLKNGSLGALIAFNGPVQGAWDTISPTIQGDLFKYMGMIKELMNLESGTSDYETETPDDRTATEATIIQKGVMSRRFKPQKRVKGFTLSQSHKIYQIVMKNAPIEHFIKVLGEEEAMDWWNDPQTGKEVWSDAELSGDYWFDYNTEEVSPISIQQRNADNKAALETVLNPALAQLLLQDKKRLKIGTVFGKFAKDNLGIRDESEIMEDLSILNPEQEHDAWMNGQFPQINPNENIEEHIQKHSAWVNSPAFKFLPQQIQHGALMHLGQYQPHIDKMNQKPVPRQKPATSNQNHPMDKPPLAAASAPGEMSMAS